MARKPGAKVFVVFEGKFALVLRDNNPDISYPNTWNMPGGGIEDGETPEQGAIRELAEEIDLHVSPERLEILEPSYYPDGSSVHRYIVRITSKEKASLRILHEGQELRFFTWNEALTSDLSPNLRSYLESIQNTPIAQRIEEAFSN